MRTCCMISYSLSVEDAAAVSICSIRWIAQPRMASPTNVECHSKRSLNN
jgi:hypothetical protein